MTALSWDDDGAQEGLLTKRSVQKCLTDREVDDFLFNRLSGVTREVVEEHLLVCHSCLDRVEEEEANRLLVRTAAMRMDETELGAGGLPQDPIGGDDADGWRPKLLDRLKNWLRRRSSGDFVYAVAAAAVLVLLAGVSVQWMRRAPAVEVPLWVERGDSTSLAQAPASAPLHLTIDLTTLPEMARYRMELVDHRGKLLATAEVGAKGTQLVWNLPAGYPAGRYWVRMREPGNSVELLREFGLTLQ